MATVGIQGGIAIAGLILGGVSAEKSRKEASKARKAQKNANKANANRADLENARSRRQQIVAARRQRAAAVAQGESQGISGGSQVAGVTGSIQSQAASNLSFLSQLQGIDQNRFNNLEEANKSLGAAATFQSIGGLGFKAAAASGQIADLFGSQNPKTTDT
jgi:hypothetical protein